MHHAPTHPHGWHEPPLTDETMIDVRASDLRRGDRVLTIDADDPAVIFTVDYVIVTETSVLAGDTDGYTMTARPRSVILVDRAAS